MRSELFIGESPCVHYRKRNAIFTAHSLRSFKTRSAQRILSFSFTVERTVNENHPKLRFIWFVSQDTSPSIESMIRWVLDTVGLLNYPARRAWVYFFSPSQRKEMTKNSLCALCVSSEAGGATLETHAIHFVHPLVCENRLFGITTPYFICSNLMISR